jgi:ABC-2 type transport system ATP-binding protein
MSDAALRFVNVSKSYGGVTALRDVCLDVRPGECFGLAGANGAGKTTLIKCMLDLSEIDAGTIEIFATEHRAAGARARLAFLPERFSPPYYLSGRDFLRYLLALHRTAYEASSTARAVAGLDLAPDALDQPARSYSKGMTQKLGLAACLLSGKELLVLDEPMTGLDPKARALFKQQLRALRASGRTVLLTSHALADIEELCDRMAILHEGRLRFTGAPSELLQAYGARNLEEAFLSCIA